MFVSLLDCEFLEGRGHVLVTSLPVAEGLAQSFPVNTERIKRPLRVVGG